MTKPEYSIPSNPDNVLVKSRRKWKPQITPPFPEVYRYREIFRDIRHEGCRKTEEQDQTGPFRPNQLPIPQMSPKIMRNIYRLVRSRVLARKTWNTARLMFRICVSPVDHVIPITLEIAYDTCPDSESPDRF